MISPLRLHAIGPDDAAPTVLDRLRAHYAWELEQAASARTMRLRDAWRHHAADTAGLIAAEERG